MHSARAYLRSSSPAIDGDEAFERLYHRLIDWCNDALAVWDSRPQRAHILERALTLLGLMDQIIDVSHHYEIASRILSLHRFAIKGVVEAKAGEDRGVLQGVLGPLLALGEIFALMHARRGERPHPA